MPDLQPDVSHTGTACIRATAIRQRGLRRASDSAHNSYVSMRAAVSCSGQRCWFNGEMSAVSPNARHPWIAATSAKLGVCVVACTTGSRSRMRSSSGCSRFSSHWSLPPVSALDISILQATGGPMSPVDKRLLPPRSQQKGPVRPTGYTTIPIRDRRRDFSRPTPRRGRATRRPSAVCETGLYALQRRAANSD